MKTRMPFRRTTSLATMLAFASTFASSDGVKAQTAPAPQSTSAPRQTRLQIEHDPLACMTTLSPPVVEATVQPGPDVSRSYVYWRAAGTPYFYYTIMEGPARDDKGVIPFQGPVKGVMPRPLPETKAVDYFVQATDTASLSRKTPEYAPPVVESRVCKEKGLALGAGAGGAGLTIGLTVENQSPVPPGFNKEDIAKVILLSGATVGLAAALAGGTGTGTGAGTGAGAPGGAGGGISSTVLIVGGIAVAGGVAAAVVVGSKDSTTTPTPTPTRTPTPTPVLNNFIEVEATWSGVGNVEVQLVGPQTGQQTLPAGCESTASRTERVIVQGANIVAGDYQVRLLAHACAVATPAQIATVVTVLTDTGPKCQSVFVNVPVGGNVIGCSFHVP